MQKKYFYSPNTFQSYSTEEISAVEQYLTSQDSEKATEAFEAAVSALFGMKFGVFVNSGSSANLLACLALGFGPNDVVITPACTFPTTLSPLLFLHAGIEFCDIDEGRYVPSVDQVIEKIRPEVTGVLIPDLVGDKFDFAELRKRLDGMGRSDVKIIEDACDTVTESVADCATASFYPSHVISAGGCGGMVLTNSEELYEKCKHLRQSQQWDLTAPGFCAAFGLENAKRFHTFAEARTKNFKHYIDKLKSCPFYKVPNDSGSLWLSMPLMCPSRYEVLQELEKFSVQTRLCMAGNILRQPFYERAFPDVKAEDFPNSDRVFEQAFLIGLHQGLSDEDIEYICDLLIFLAQKYQYKPKK